MRSLNFPKRVTIELTNSCNLSCSFCPRRYMDYPIGFMKEKLFKKLVDELVEQGCQTIVPFFRGEPLMHRDCLELLAYAKQKGCIIQFTTNANLLSPSIARQLVALKVDFISLSLDSIDPEEYHRLRKGADFDKMMSGVESIFQERQRQGLFNRIQVSAVDTGMSDEQKTRFKGFWASRADQVRIYPQHTRDGNFGSLTQKPTPMRRPCQKPFEEMIIYWDGQAAICNHDWNRHQGLGDTSQASLDEIWNNIAYRKLRQKQNSLTFATDDICHDCDHWLQYCDSPQTIGEIYP